MLIFQDPPHMTTLVKTAMLIFQDPPHMTTLVETAMLNFQDIAPHDNFGGKQPC